MNHNLQLQLSNNAPCPVIRPSQLQLATHKPGQTHLSGGNFVYFETSKNENNVSPAGLPALPAMMMIIISACQLCVKVTFLQGWPSSSSTYIPP